MDELVKGLLLLVALPLIVLGKLLEVLAIVIDEVMVSVRRWAQEHADPPP